MENKYIGPTKILVVTDCDEKTPLGSPMKTVTFETGKIKNIPETLLNRLVSDEPVDLTALRTKWIDPVVNQIIILLQENDVVLEDIEYLVNTLLSSIEHKSSEAISKLFGVDFYGQRTLLQVEKIINEKSTDTKGE